MNIDKYIDEYGSDNLDIEIWKDIFYADSMYQYQISNYGRFRNKTTGNIIKPYFKIEETFDGKRSPGYYRAVLKSKDGHKTWKPTIHKLVAIYFVPNPDPEKFIQVDHIDGNKYNNHYSNLEWVTGDENIRRAVDMKLREPQLGESNSCSKWKEYEVRFIWALIEKGLTHYEIYNEYINEFPEHKSAGQLKNLFYNLVHKTNPKWTHITKRVVN